MISCRLCGSPSAGPTCPAAAKRACEGRRSLAGLHTGFRVPYQFPTTVCQGVREFETSQTFVGNGLCAVPRSRRPHGNATEGVPYRLEFPDGLNYSLSMLPWFVRAPMKQRAYYVMPQPDPWLQPTRGSGRVNQRRRAQRPRHARRRRPGERRQGAGRRARKAPG